MRVKATIKNFSFGFIGQIINNLLSFAARTVFIYYLSVEYLGINSLFANILTVFSLAELGIGSSIIIYLYEPFAKNDFNKVNALTNLYGKTYKIIGVIVAILGLLMLPFLNYIVGQNSIENLNLIFLLFVLNSSISYFLSYYRAVITADQKEYVVFKLTYIFLFIQYLLQILVLYFTQNYILFLSVAILINFSTNYAIRLKARSLYPFLKNKKKYNLTKSESKHIFSRVLAMMSHKVGSIVLNSTDNIIISSFLGVYWVGLFSNYQLLLIIINGLVLKLFSVMSASIGNLYFTSDKDKTFDIYKVVLFLGFWIYGFSAICFMILFNPFIKIWIGNKFLLDQNIVLIISLNFYLIGLSLINMNYINITKLFWKTKLKPWIAVFINLVLSVFLTKEFGLIGVFSATFFSVLTTSFWIDPFVLFKFEFKQSLWSYFKNYFSNFLITIFIGVLTYLLTTLSTNFLYLLIICIIFPNVSFYLAYRKTNEFKYILNAIKKII